MREILGALLAANIIGFAVMVYMLHDHNDEYHNEVDNRRVQVEDLPPRERPDANIEIIGRSDRSPHYQRNGNWQRQSRCPSHFRYERADIYVDIHNGHHYQYIGSNTYINLSTGRRYCP